MRAQSGRSNHCRAARRRKFGPQVDGCVRHEGLRKAHTVSHHFGAETVPRIAIAASCRSGCPAAGRIRGILGVPEILPTVPPEPARTAEIWPFRTDLPVQCQVGYRGAKVARFPSLALTGVVDSSLRVAEEIPVLPVHSTCAAQPRPPGPPSRRGLPAPRRPAPGAAPQPVSLGPQGHTRRP